MQFGTFLRTFILPDNANLEGIQTKMENGVLIVIINKIKICEDSILTISDESKNIKQEIRTKTT